MSWAGVCADHRLRRPGLSGGLTRPATVAVPMRTPAGAAASAAASRAPKARAYPAVHTAATRTSPCRSASRPRTGPVAAWPRV